MDRSVAEGEVIKNLNTGDTKLRAMQLTSDIKKISPISYSVTLVLATDDALELRSNYNKEAIKSSHVEGFRKGKAPIEVIIAKVGREEYERDLREYIASKALEEVLEKEEISPIIKPIFEFSDWKPGEKFVFTALIHTAPKDPSEIAEQPGINLPEPGRGASGPFGPDIAIPGLSGQMPIIDGKPPSPHQGIYSQPVIPSSPEHVSPPTNIPSGDPTAPIHRIPKRPDELLKTPELPEEPGEHPVAEGQVSNGEG